jgi:peptidoglycan/xylan/chitin deacetylase (PgdA/CDA1 family)
MFRRIRKGALTACALSVMLFAVSVVRPIAASAGEAKGNQTDVRMRSDAQPKPVPVQSAKEQRMTLSELREKYPEIFFNRGSRKNKQVALTFDDVPDIRFTPQLLDVLKRYEIKATFFIVGYRAQNHPDLVRRMVREGHALGNHSYNHALMTKTTLPKFEKQIMRTQSIIRSLTGQAPKYYRPPYGEINEEQLRWAERHGFTVVNWDVDSLDWKGLSASEVAGNIIPAVKPGSIVLQHGGGGKGQDLSGTIEALPKIIEQLRSQGYSFVTIPELLNSGE